MYISATQNGSGSRLTEYAGPPRPVVAATAPARERITRAMVYNVTRRGFAQTTVSGVCAHARVSRATFYETFDGLQDCFLAILDDGHRNAHALICAAFAGQEDWLDGVRDALMSLLAFFDAEPQLARVWIVESLAAGAWALECRERHLRALAEMILARWPAAAGVQSNPLAAAGVLELVLGILHRRLLLHSDEPLVGLLGPLMGLIAAVYHGAHATRGEIEHANHLTGTIPGQRERPLQAQASRGFEIPSLLRDPRAYRARQCVLCLQGHPGASNRQVAAVLGIARAAQASKLLNRLHGLGLLAKHECSPGGPNAWSLTPLGIAVAKTLES
jgi:AcrR family transcriptional regulator